MSDQPVIHQSGKPMFFDPEVRRIRSFVTRAGRLSTGQERAIHELGPQFCIPFAKTALDYTKLFNRKAKTIFEIGFGMGETTATIAENLPELNFIGVEVHTPGVGSLLKLIGEKQLSNIRIIQHDAVEVLENMIAENSLDGVHIFFPDPWHKARHHKRRLIQPDFCPVPDNPSVGKRLSALRDRLAELCRANAGSPERRNRSGQYGYRVCRTARLPSCHQI